MAVGRQLLKKVFLILAHLLVVQVASSAPAASSEASSESTTASSEGTITVQAGEGEAAIAARAGISIAELERLNPSHMTTGSWYANPGDVVKTR